MHNCRRISVLGAVAIGFLMASSLTAQVAANVNAGSAPQVTAPPAKPNTYGTNFQSFSRIPFNDFLPADSGTTWSDLSITSFTFSRFPTANSGNAFVAVAKLPSGASIEQVEYDFCDTNAASDTTLNLYGGSFDGTGNVLQGTTQSSGSAGCGFSVATLPTPYVIDNNFNEFTLVAFVPATDGSLAISGAIIRYKLTVSPAPLTQTFNDVAPGDFGYQFIEALAASGITGGCGGGNYCPNATLTRAQMAIFLSKALGLYFQ